MNLKTFENRILNTDILTLQNAGEEEFCAQCRRLEEEGFCKRESRPGYAAYQKEGTGCFLGYYPAIGEVRVVTEQNCRYFDYTDTCGEAVTVPQITQLHLEDFGMSYAVRLSDGRFILIDGGCSFEPDAERLFRVLQEGSPFEKPVIAAWIMTHPHSDHFHCIFPFMELHAEVVTIEKFLFHFPAADDTAHYPKMAERDDRFEMDTSNTATVPQFLKIVEESGAAVYTPHAGQTYQIGDAVCEILSSPDDTVHCSNSINAASLVIRMELGGQVILWAADASFEAARLPERYGHHLKADILQVPHHGFGCGSADAQIAGFDLIRPKICLLPARDYVAYTFFSAFKEGTRHLMADLDVSEFITGEHTRTLTLPYTPKPYAKEQSLRQYHEGQVGAGAKNWYFTELSTARKEDFIFTVLNPVVSKTNLTIELFFEKAPKVTFIKASIAPNSMKRLCIIDPEQVETETECFNPNSLETVGVPENAPFGVRFISDSPLVISHKDHPAAYRG